MRLGDAIHTQFIDDVSRCDAHRRPSKASRRASFGLMSKRSSRLPSFQPKIGILFKMLPTVTINIMHFHILKIFFVRYVLYMMHQHGLVIWISDKICSAQFFYNRDAKRLTTSRGFLTKIFMCYAANNKEGKSFYDY